MATVILKKLAMMLVKRAAAKAIKRMVMSAFM